MIKEVIQCAALINTSFNMWPWLKTVK